MNGYIDIHTHLLPGFDDGSRSEEETLAVLEIAQREGFSRVLFTPHLIVGSYDHTAEDIDEAVHALDELVRSRGLSLALGWGAENFLDDAFLEILESGGAIPYPDGKHLLVEMPFMRFPPYLEEITFRLLMRRYIPVLAHPERYTDVIKKPRKLEELVERGYEVQVNLGSFIGLYGKSVRKAAEKLVDMGIVDYVASDIHSIEHAEALYIDGLERFMKLARGEAEIILGENPLKLLSPPRPEKGEQ